MYQLILHASFHTYMQTHIHKYTRTNSQTHINAKYFGLICRDTHGWLSTHTQLGHSTHLKKSCHTYERVLAHIQVSHGSHMYVSRHRAHTVCVTCTHMNSSNIYTGHTHVCVMAHLWMHQVYTPEDTSICHGTHMNSLNIHTGTHMYASHELIKHIYRHTHVCVTAHIRTHQTYILAHTCMRHVHTHELIIHIYWAHTCMRHGTHMNASNIYTGTHMYASQHTRELINHIYRQTHATAHIWSHQAHMNSSSTYELIKHIYQHIHVCVTTHTWMNKTCIYRKPEVSSSEYPRTEAAPASRRAELPPRSMAPRSKRTSPSRRASNSSIVPAPDEGACWERDGGGSMREKGGGG